MPSTPPELPPDQETPFSVMWFETTLGVKYEMPDMQEHEVTEAHKNLDATFKDQYFHVRNTSGVIMMIPKRIIKKAGVKDRCFWEVG
jgi:hypothetical protein